jgi:molybdenum cofactor cytidylyltransferase
MTVDLYVLAAGRSVRMGRPKALVELGGTSLLGRTVRAGQASSVRSVTVVTGSSYREVEALASCLAAGTVRNERYRDGLAASVAAAARHAGLRDRSADGLLLAGCDQPYMTAGLLNRMVAEAREMPDRAVACRYGETIGIPALFPSDWWPELLELRGDRGAKQVLQQHRGRLVEIEWEAGRINVNSQADLDRIDPASLPGPGNPIMIV